MNSKEIISLVGGIFLGGSIFQFAYAPMISEGLITISVGLILVSISMGMVFI